MNQRFSRSTFGLSLVVGVALVAAIALLGWLPGWWSSRRLAQDAAQMRREIRNQYGAGVSIEQAIRELQEQERQLEARIQELTAAVAFVPDERFRLEGNVPQAGLRYASTRDRLQAVLAEEAARIGLSLPGTLDPRGETRTVADDEAAEMLFRLAMNERVVRAAIRARLRRIDSLKHEIKKVRLPGPSPFIEPVATEVECVGSPEATVEFLRHVQQADGSSQSSGYLLLRLARLLPADERADLLKCTFTLEALRVNHQGLLPEEMPTAPGRLPIPMTPVAPTSRTPVRPGY